MGCFNKNNKFQKFMKIQLNFNFFMIKLKLEFQNIFFYMDILVVAKHLLQNPYNNNLK